MPRPRTEALEIAERRRKVASLYLRGKLQHEIAAVVGIDQGNVSRDLAALHKEWLASSLRDFDARKAEELARIDAIEAEAWAGWVRSCADAEISHVRIEGKDGEEKTVREKTTKGQAGDPRFLSQIGWCVEQRLKILGGYAPTKIAPTTPDGNGPYPGDNGSLLAALLRAAAEVGAGSNSGETDTGPADAAGGPPGAATLGAVPGAAGAGVPQPGG